MPFGPLQGIIKFMAINVIFFVLVFGNSMMCILTQLMVYKKK